MATVEPKALYGVSPATPQEKYFTVSIAQGGWLDSANAAGGRVSPCVASDFATKPTTLAESLKVSRGNMRWKMMTDSIGTRTNFKIHNIITTYASDAGDTPIGTLAFGLVFENGDYIPSSGTDIASSSYSTKALWIKDKIGEALNSTKTENCLVYDPTLVSGVKVRESSTTAVSVQAVHGTPGTIVSGITVTEVAGFDVNTAGQKVADVSLTYSAE
jgi:hypothetical protein